MAVSATHKDMHHGLILFKQMPSYSFTNIDGLLGSVGCGLGVGVCDRAPMACGKPVTLLTVNPGMAWLLRVI